MQLKLAMHVVCPHVRPCQHMCQIAVETLVLAVYCEPKRVFRFVKKHISREHVN